jgi:hypothetical protein
MDKFGTKVSSQERFRCAHNTHCALPPTAAAAAAAAATAAAQPTSGQNALHFHPLPPI